MGFTSMTSHPTLWPRHHVSPLPLVPKQRPWYRLSIIHPRINCNPSMIISRSWRRFAFYILHRYQFLRLIISPFENPQISNPKIKKELLKHLMYKQQYHLIEHRVDTFTRGWVTSRTIPSAPSLTAQKVERGAWCSVPEWRPYLRPCYVF